MGILLQVSDSAHAAGAIQQAAETFNLWSIMEKGGVLMYPLYLLFAATIFIFFERLIAIGKAS